MTGFYKENDALGTKHIIFPDALGQRKSTFIQVYSLLLNITECGFHQRFCAGCGHGARHVGKVWSSPHNCAVLGDRDIQDGYSQSEPTTVFYTARESYRPQG